MQSTKKSNHARTQGPKGKSLTLTLEQRHPPIRILSLHTEIRMIIDIKRIELQNLLLMNFIIETVSVRIVSRESGPRGPG